MVIDNYDSFTYNLVQYLGDCGIKDPIVFKNDEKTVEEIRRMNPKGILVSPGPGRPEDSGISLEVVEKLGPEFSVFGVCMGHQCNRSSVRRNHHASTVRVNAREKFPGVP